jgi:hypothetical protein
MPHKETRGEFKLIPILFFMLTTIMLVGGASAVVPSASTEITAAQESATSQNYQAEEIEGDANGDASNVVLPREATRDVAMVANPWHGYPNVCETFTVIEGTKQVKNKKGQKVWPVRHRRNRYQRKHSDQRRTRDLIKMVVAEMGGDEDAQRIVSMIAMHESSWNPEAIHILNPDREANKKAWERHTHTLEAEQRIRERMQAASKKTNKDGYYGLKARMSDIQLYKGNPHWHDELEYTHRIPEREIHGETVPETTWLEQRSVWAFGYGLYGMNAVLFTHLWDKEAPPWILCGDEGIQATVAAVWALRRIQVECDSLSKDQPDKYGVEGGTAKGVVRRFGRGRCSDKRLGKVWRKLMAQIDIDWDSHPDFGTNFPRYEMKKRRGKLVFRRDANRKKIRTDRAEILAHMREKATKKRLLRKAPLERKDPDSVPVIVTPEPPELPKVALKN